MESNITLLFGILISCLVYTISLYQFMEEHYMRIYESKALYCVLQVISCGMMIGVNLLDIPILNLLSWIVIFGCVSIKFYTDFEKSSSQRAIEIIVLLLILTACETIGYLLFEFALWKLHILNIQPMMYECLHMTFSKLVILILYYLFIVRLWKNTGKNKLTKAQYIIYGIIVVYSVMNLFVIIVVVSKGMQTTFAERLLLLVNMFCIVFGDLLILYFTKFAEENGQLKTKLMLLEQQASLQYEYYLEQTNKYDESIRILHDVNKHLALLDDLYKLECKEEAKEYEKEIKEMLFPLIPQEYTNHAILNVILNDKKRCANACEIKFDLEIGEVDMAFMSPIEITTIFVNLLDNAIDACKCVKKNRYIKIKLDTYNDFVAIHISNSMEGKLMWYHGKPVSRKGKNHGIGLINVENTIKKYNGNMILKEKQGEFVCDIILNS